jgi:hypothetical protein
MEAKEIICPQCGLANNGLAESCVQCGIIFIKNPAMSTHAIQDDRKRKAIEEAEAMLDDCQAPSENIASGDDDANRPDPHADTLEIQMPEEETTDIKREAELPEEPNPEAEKNTAHQEIQMEALEATMEAVDGTMDAEALFLSDVKAAGSAETATAETVQKAPGLPSAAEIAGDQNGEPHNSKCDREDSRSPEAVDLTVKPVPGDNPLDEPRREENRKENGSVEAKAETGAVAESETAVTEIVEPASAGDHAIPADAAPPAEQKNQREEKVEPAKAEAALATAEAPIYANATVEMPKELVEENARTDQQVEQARQDALKRQQEAQAKAEVLEKEKAAEAAAIKKRKLARAQAEALKKQKAAQAKAEALKKRKESRAKVKAAKNQATVQARADALKKQRAAQTRAEASSQEVQCASCSQLAAAANMNHYERLLGMLKRYKGKAIGINYDNSSEIREAELVDANEEFFSVRVKDKKLQYSYPLNTILTIIEGQEGVETGEGVKKARFDAVIKVYPLVLS